MFRFVLLRPPNPEEEAKTIIVEEKTPFFDILKVAAKGETPKKAVADAANTFLKNNKLVVTHNLQYESLFDKLIEVNENPTFRKICAAIESVFKKKLNTIIKDEGFIKDKKNLSEFIYAIKIKSSSVGYDLKKIKTNLKIIHFIEYVAKAEIDVTEKKPIGKEKNIWLLAWLRAIINFIKKLFGREEKAKTAFCQKGVIKQYFNRTIKLPADLFPISIPKIKDVGVGDLLVVKEKIKRYEAGEIAHIENILKGEFKERSHRRLNRSEETFLIETERTTEEEQELSSSERFELQQETSEILREEVKSKSGAGFSVDAGIKGAGIGFTYYVDGNVNGSVENSSTTASENATRKASNFAREVSNKAASRITERKREEQIRKTIQEIEEINKHGFDNKGGSKHVVGIYQWIDKVYEAQVFNYGKRMLFDFMVPEPAAFLRKAVENNIPNIEGDPGEFTLLFSGNEKKPGETQADADERAFIEAINLYKVTGIKAPIEKYKWIAKELKLPSTDKAGDDDIFDAGKISIDAGYRVTKIIADSTGWQSLGANNAKVRLKVGGKRIGFMRFDYNTDIWQAGAKKDDGSHDVTVIATGAMVNEPYSGGVGTLRGEIVYGAKEIVTKEVAYAVAAFKIRGLSATIHLVCERTEEKYNEWKRETYDAILQEYLKQKSAYDEKVAAAQIQEGVQISGRPAEENRRIEKTELKKSIISIFSHDQPNLKDKPFDDFDSIDVVPVNNAAGTKIYDSHQVNVDESLKEGRIVRFFEQAFEWEHMMYVLYPYFWSRKKTWLDRILTEDTDPKHAEFLRAGSARVVVPVSENFDAAVTHFLETGNIPDDDELWDINSPLYKPIVEEIKERQDATGKEEPVDKPWEVRLPTTLVKLRDDSSLPRWKKNDDGTWSPEN